MNLPPWQTAIEFFDKLCSDIRSINGCLGLITFGLLLWTISNVQSPFDSLWSFVKCLFYCGMTCVSGFAAMVSSQIRTNDIQYFASRLVHMEDENKKIKEDLIFLRRKNTQLINELRRRSSQAKHSSQA